MVDSATTARGQVANDTGEAKMLSYARPGAIAREIGWPFRYPANTPPCPAISKGTARKWKWIHACLRVQTSTSDLKQRLIVLVV
jgi:hypothetical protein